jgi:hypothetical protein
VVITQAEGWSTPDSRINPYIHILLTGLTLLTRL